MKIVVLDGELEAKWCGRVIQELEKALPQAEVETFALRDCNIKYCLGCFGCWLKTPGVCVIPDDGRAVAKAAAQCDLLVFLTPVTFGGYSSVLKKAVDRLIPNVSAFFTRINGETHHVKRYKSYPQLAAIGYGATSEASETVFRTLVERNSLNYHNPKHAVAFMDKTTDTQGLIREILSKTGVAI